jgi:hypothetical protein
MRAVIAGVSGFVGAGAGAGPCAAMVTVATAASSSAVQDRRWVVI